jgi:glycosyltransferase involved in cell wall biosynthesis
VLRCTTDARRGRARQLAGLSRFALAIARFRPDAVHVHTGGATGGLAPVAMARALTRATVGITEHDVPAARPSRKQAVARALLDRACHLVIAVSRRNAALRQARIPVRSKHFAVVLNGVPVPAACPRAPAVRAELGLGADDTVIGTLVRLAPGKGLETLLRAFALVRATSGRGRCRLLIVGDGPLRVDLERLAVELGVGRDVVFAGHQELPLPYLLAMDVFCLPVPAGSMSIALLEAMAAGLPPVITFGGPEEAVIDGRTGLVAPPSDPAALAAALGRLVDDAALREKLGHAARCHVEVNYSTARVADDLLDAFASARQGRLVERLRADGPPDREPGVSARRDGRTVVHARTSREPVGPAAP